MHSTSASEQCEGEVPNFIAVRSSTQNANYSGSPLLRVTKVRNPSYETMSKKPQPGAATMFLSGPVIPKVKGNARPRPKPSPKPIPTTMLV
ncbi:hypothetical protein BDN71DRAFT_381286 [Pleurotus eryngii]|uniref:Uncharacterized protein n=1 Tax=Pleurotus eryngii TaxID=5323 RepID=A0A9P6A649_PLEER|nr:hypothetical protein BDN71DRAFT_381286 [Pleurotus eryngii]